MRAGEAGSDRFVSWSGIAGAIGGVLWVISTVMHASRPVGCVAEECARRTMRESSAVEGMLTVAALLLFAVATAGLIVLVLRTGRFGTTGRLGAVLTAAGVLVLVLAGLAQALVFDGDFPLMPYFVVPAVAASIIGVVVLAVTVLRSRVLPGWAGGSLMVGALAMVGFNEQTEAAWLALPFGVAWIAVGYALWDGRRHAAAVMARTSAP